MRDPKVPQMTPHQMYLCLPVQVRLERRWARIAELQAWHNEHGTKYAEVEEAEA